MKANSTRTVSVFFLVIATAGVVIGLVYGLFARRVEQWNATDASAPEVVAVYDRMITAAEALDLNALYSHVAETEHGALVVNGEVFWTRSAAREQTERDFRGIAGVHYELKHKAAHRLSAESALLIARGTVHATTHEERELTADFVHTVVFVRQNETWKVLHSHQSTLRPL